MVTPDRRFLEEPGVAAEIGGDDSRVGGNLRRGALGQHAPLVEDHGALRPPPRRGVAARPGRAPPPGGGAPEAVGGVKRPRLAGAVGPNRPPRLALVDLERDAVPGPPPAVAHDDLSHVEQWSRAAVEVDG